MHIEIIPAFLVESREEFEKKLALVDGACETIHVDVLDGTLFPHTSWFDAVAVGAMRAKVKFELHLMVENPLPIVEAWQKEVAGFTRAIVHAEIHRPLGALASMIRDRMKLEMGVALNPETPFDEIHEVLHAIDQVTVMGVHPGSSGQPFLGEYLLEKIQAIRNHRPDLAIEVDGGLTEELAPRLVSAGATRLCGASAVFHTDNPQKALTHLFAISTPPSGS